MIDLEDREAGLSMRIAQPERVEPRAEYDELAHAPRHRLGEALLGEAAARGDEEAHGAPIGIFLRFADDRLGRLAEDGDCKRIAENRAALEQLMDRAMSR